MNGERFDVAIVGAGVIGAAIATELSHRAFRVLWLEAAHDVAEGASKGNSAILCTGYDMPVGTLESDLVLAASPTWERTCRALDVPFRRIGALALAFAEPDLERLQTLAEQAAEAGVEAELVDGARLEALTCGLAPGALRALHVPGEAIVDPMRLTVGWAELAVRNGVVLRCSTPVTAFRRAADGRISHVCTPSGEAAVGAVVNAAGLHVDRIAEAAGAEPLQMWPRKGQFLLLDRSLGERVPRILATIPTDQTRGILAVPTTNRTVLLGPTAEDGTDRSDRDTEEPTLERILEQARRLVPGVTRDHVIKVFAGLRPASDRTYRIERSEAVPNLIHAAGIRSTGVSSSPAVAVRVRGLLAAAGIDAPERPTARASIPAVPRLAELASADAAALAESDPAYRTVVCACEHVTAAEIRAACTSPVPARSLDGVRKRTRAMAGRCQGAYCQAGVGFVLSMEQGLDPWAVPQGEPGSTWGVAGG